MIERVVRLGSFIIIFIGTFLFVRGCIVGFKSQEEIRQKRIECVDSCIEKNGNDCIKNCRWKNPGLF